MTRPRARWLILAGLVALFLGIGAAGARADAIDRVEVHKAKRELSLLSQGQVVKTYRISLGRDPLGHKQEEGDSRTPEGDYVIDYRNPNSSFHLSLHISYPDRNDRGNAKLRGVSPGGMIMIHGLPNGMGWAQAHFVGRDWTDGCIAVTNDQIEEIWRLVPNGTPISIKP